MKNKLILLFLIAVILIPLALYFYDYYRTNYEKNIIRRFIKENLRENYYPDKLDVEKGLVFTNETTGRDNLYGGIWHVENTKFYANLHYNLTNPKISHLQIFIHADEIPDKPEVLDEIKASSLFDKYFKVKSENEIKCETLMTNIVYCEKFWTELNGNKKGVGILVGILNGTTDKFMGICEYPKESENYGYNTCFRAHQ